MREDRIEGGVREGAELVRDWGGRCGFFFVRGIFVSQMLYVEWVASQPT
jgi:hypothetical protein